MAQHRLHHRSRSPARRRRAAKKGGADDQGPGRSRGGLSTEIHAAADRLHDAILEAGATPVIPPKRNRRHQHGYDKDIYKERNRIERFFNKLKHFRRVATRYHKLLANFMGFVTLAAIAIQLP